MKLMYLFVKCMIRFALLYFLCIATTSTSLADCLSEDVAPCECGGGGGGDATRPYWTQLASYNWWAECSKPLSPCNQGSIGGTFDNKLVKVSGSGSFTYCTVYWRVEVYVDMCILNKWGGEPCNAPGATRNRPSAPCQP